MAIDYRQKFKEKLEKNKAVQKKIHEKYDKLLDATNHWEEYKKPRNTQAEIEAYEISSKKFKDIIDKKNKALFRSYHENPQDFYDQGYKALEEKYQKKSAAQSRLRDAQQYNVDAVRNQRSKINRGSNKFNTPIEERLNNYKSNKPRPKQVNPNFNNNSGNLSSKAKKAFKDDYLGRKQKITAKTDKVDPTTHTLDLNYSVDGAGTRVNSRGKLGGGRKAGNNIKSRTKAGVGTGVETGNRLLSPTSNTGTVNAATKKPAAAAPKAGRQKHIYTVFDFETNGKVKGNGVDKVMPEVLSYSAQKYELDLLTGESVLKGSMEGYYQPKDGNFNGGAQSVHGLNEEKINVARTDKNYGAAFEDDKAKLIEFMNKDSDAIVAHNLNEFDGNYFVGELDKNITKIDTYTEAKKARLETDVLQYSEAKNGDIHTKTNSSVYHYYENKMPEGDLHNAANDVKITAENYHNMVLDEKTGLADNLGLDKTKVKEFKRAKSNHYYRTTVGKDGEKITTKMSKETNKPLTVNGEVAKALKEKEKIAAGVTRKDIAENAKAATRKFGDTMREFGTAAKKFGDDFSKLSTGKKAGRIAGVSAVVGGGALLVKTAKDRRKAEQEKLKLITASVEKNRSGGF